MSSAVKILLASMAVFFIFNSCNGVSNQQVKNDSTRSAGVKEQDDNHSGGPGDSALSRKTDSSRVAHGGEIKNASSRSDSTLKK